MIKDKFISFTVPAQKNIALIAHDNKKQELIEWVREHEDILKSHFLSGTGTTARLISEKTNLPVRAYNSGPLGGDQQIGARVVEGRIDFIVFFWDPLESQPHDPDIRALQRIATVYDVPLAANRSTADFMITSEFMNKAYDRHVINYNLVINDRLEDFREEDEDK